MAGVAVLATSRLSSYYALYCLLCKQTMQSEAKQSLHRGEKKDRPKHDQEQTPKEAEGGWVRIRDVNNPRIHTFLALWVVVVDISQFPNYYRGSDFLPPW